MMLKLAGRIFMKVLTDLHLACTMHFKRRFLHLAKQECVVKINQMWTNLSLVITWRQSSSWMENYFSLKKGKYVLYLLSLIYGLVSYMFVWIWCVLSSGWHICIMSWWDSLSFWKFTRLITRILQFFFVIVILYTAIHFLWVDLAAVNTIRIIIYSIIKQQRDKMLRKHLHFLFKPITLKGGRLDFHYSRFRSAVYILKLSLIWMPFYLDRLK